MIYKCYYERILDVYAYFSSCTEECDPTTSAAEMGSSVFQIDEFLLVYISIKLVWES